MKKLLRKLKCLFGSHGDIFYKAELGGRNVGRCIYCKKILREDKVTVGQARAQRNYR